VAETKQMINTNTDRMKSLETAISGIEKQFGKGAVMRLGSSRHLQVESIPTGSLSLDYALGVGGMPRGRIVEIFGPESSGKTTVALHSVAQAQKAGGTAAFIDVEHALDPNYAKKLGVDTENLLIAQPSSGEEALEITEMLVMNMGQYAHGNQPIQHMPYLFAFAGQPWKTQYHVRNIMDKLYSPAPDGLCGDEDNGQTSAWYVFSAMGMYPVTPASGQYVLGSPLFNKITLHLENGKSFIINAPDNNQNNCYVKKAMLNNKPYSKNFILHDDILKGGTLTFSMDQLPNTTKGTLKDDAPYSMSGLVR